MSREAGAWLEKLVLDFAGVAIGETVPKPLRPDVPSALPDRADLAVSVAVAGVAETGSLILDARDGPPGSAPSAEPRRVRGIPRRARYARRCTLRPAQ